MNSPLRRFIEALFGEQIMLAAVIATCVVLIGGTSLGIEWHLTPGAAFSRLVANPSVAECEAWLAFALLLLVRYGRSHPLKVRAAAGAAWLVAAYLGIFYFVGTEILLLFATTRIVAQYERTPHANRS